MKTTRIFATLILIFALFSAVSCTAPEKDLWQDAVFTEDFEIGEGAKTLTVKITAGEKTITATVHTDREFLGEALLELGIIEGSIGQYGLYMDKVNGILADYSIDRTYWALYINGSYANTGIDTTPANDGENYDLVKE